MMSCSESPSPVANKPAMTLAINTKIGMNALNARDLLGSFGSNCFDSASLV